MRVTYSTACSAASSTVFYAWCAIMRVAYSKACSAASSTVFYAWCAIMRVAYSTACSAASCTVFYAWCAIMRVAYSTACSAASSTVFYDWWAVMCRWPALCICILLACPVSLHTVIYRSASSTKLMQCSLVSFVCCCAFEHVQYMFKQYMFKCT